MHFVGPNVIYSPDVRQFRRRLPHHLLRLNIEDVLIDVWHDDVLKLVSQTCHVLSLFCDASDDIEVAVVLELLALIPAWLLRFALQSQSH